MSIDTTTFFTGLGRFIKQFQTFDNLQTTLLYTTGSGLQDITPEYTSQPNVTSGLDQAFQGFASSASQWESQLYTYTNNAIAALQSQLNASSSSPSTVLPLLSSYMETNSVSINRTITSAPSSGTAGSSNVGTGVLVAMGDTEKGYPSELIQAEQVTFTCTSSGSNGGQYGAEGFSVSGYATRASKFTVYATSTGSGTYTGFSTANRSQKYNSLSSTNGDFNQYSNSAFQSWSTPTFSASASYTAVITANTSTVETLPSPASSAVAVTAGQAISWVLPSSLPSGATSFNLYMDNGSGIYRLIYAGLPAGLTIPVGAMTPGRPPPTTGGTAPASAITGTAYTPALPTQDTTRVWASVAGGALLLKQSSAGPSYITQSVSSIQNFSLQWIFSAALAQFNNTAGTSRLTIALINADPEYTVIFDGDPSTLTNDYQLKYSTFWGKSVNPASSILISYSATGAPTNAEVLVDSMVLGQSLRFGNVGYWLLRGQTDFQIGDTFTVSTSVTSSGGFQAFFARYYGVTLNSSTTPTISDSLIV